MLCETAEEKKDRECVCVRVREVSSAPGPVALEPEKPDIWTAATARAGWSLRHTSWKTTS